MARMIDTWPDEASIRREMDRLEKEVCECVTCGDCNGKGYICYSHSLYDPGDNDAEPCDCAGGISQTCQRCSELRDLDEDLQTLAQDRGLATAAGNSE